jgi:hypothetical protein
MEINQDFLDLYAPSNVRSLSKDQVAAMKDFTKEQIYALAKAYPNTGAAGMAYLILGNRKLSPEKQLFPRSTWQNLANLIRQGESDFYPYSFKAIFQGRPKPLPVAKAQDLTKEQAKSAEGLKKGNPQTAKEVTDKVPEGNEQNAQEGQEDKPALMKLKVDELTTKYLEKFDVDVPKKSKKEQIVDALLSGEMIPEAE